MTQLILATTRLSVPSVLFNVTACQENCIQNIKTPFKFNMSHIRVTMI